MQGIKQQTKTKKNYQVLTIRSKQNFSFNIISWTSLLLKGNLLYYSLFSVIYIFFFSGICDVNENPVKQLSFFFSF